MNPLIKAIDLISSGNQAGFAKAINEELGLTGSDAIAPQQVWNWINRGDAIPPQYCPAIEKLSDNKVSRSELRPTDWQQIWPESVELVATDRAPGLIEGKPIDGAVVREAVNGLRIPVTDTRKLRE